MQDSNQKRVSWGGIGMLFSTFAVIVLIMMFCFSFYKTSSLGKQLQNNVASLQEQVKMLQANQESIRQDFQQTSETLKQVAGVVQQQLQDRVKLQSLPQMDYTDVYLRLSALDQQIDSLPLLTKPIAESSVQPVTQPSTSWWQRGLQEAWQGLQKIIVIRYSATNIPPLLTPDQQLFLRQNLHSMLQQAMWAVLNKNAQVYQASLQQAVNWIKQYFVTASAVTENVLTNLNQLQKIDIHPVSAPSSRGLTAGSSSTSY